MTTQRYGAPDAKCWAINDGIRWYPVFKCHGAEVQIPLYFTSEARMRQTVDAINNELQGQETGELTEPPTFGVDVGRDSGSLHVVDVVERHDPDAWTVEEILAREG